jgi:hypothetical protein
MSYVNAIVGEFMGMNGKTVTPQYQAPKKPWVGLTNEERSKIWGELPSTLNEERDACIFAEAIELYLKERNI